MLHFVNVMKKNQVLNQEHENLILCSIIAKTIGYGSVLCPGGGDISSSCSNNSNNSNEDENLHSPAWNIKTYNILLTDALLMGNNVEVANILQQMTIKQVKHNKRTTNILQQMKLNITAKSAKIKLI